MASGSVQIPNWAQHIASLSQPGRPSTGSFQASTQSSPPAATPPVDNGTAAPGSFSALASLGNQIGGSQLAQILNEFTQNYNTYGDKMRGANQDQIRAGLQQRGLTETPSGQDIEARGNTDFNNQLAQGYVQQTMPFAQQMAQAMAQLRSNRQQMELNLEQAQKMIPIDSQAFHQGARDYKSEYPSQNNNQSTMDAYNALRSEQIRQNNPGSLLGDGESSTGEITGDPAVGTGVQSYADWKSKGGFGKNEPTDYSFSRDLAAQYTANKNPAAAAAARDAVENDRYGYTPPQGTSPQTSPKTPTQSTPASTASPRQRVQVDYGTQPAIRGGNGSYSNLPAGYYPGTSTPPKPQVKAPVVQRPTSGNYWND